MGQSLLLLATQNPDIGVFKAIIKQGGKLDFLGPDGENILHRAVLAQNEELVFQFQQPLSPYSFNSKPHFR